MELRPLIARAGKQNRAVTRSDVEVRENGRPGGRIRRELLDVLCEDGKISKIAQANAGAVKALPSHAWTVTVTSAGHPANHVVSVSRRERQY